MLISFIRTVILYSILILVIRLMGKRQLGEMEPMEFVVTMLLANLAAVPMQETGIPLLAGLIPILVVLSMELLLSVLVYHSVHARRLLCGKPVILMENGRLLQDNMKKTRITPDELTEFARMEGITDLSGVKYAILETGGQISILPYTKYKPACAKDAGVKVEDAQLPVTVISDGHVLRENLPKLGKPRAWVDEVLRKRRVPSFLHAGRNAVLLQKGVKPDAPYSSFVRHFAAGALVLPVFDAAHPRDLQANTLRAHKRAGAGANI